MAFKKLKTSFIKNLNCSISYKFILDSKMIHTVKMSFILLDGEQVLEGNKGKKRGKKEFEV